MILRDWEEAEEQNRRSQGRVQLGNAAFDLAEDMSEDETSSGGTGSSTYDLYKDMGGKPTRLGGTFGVQPSEAEERYHNELAEQILQAKGSCEKKLSVLERVRLYFLGY